MKRRSPGRAAGAKSAGEKPSTIENTVKVIDLPGHGVVFIQVPLGPATEDPVGPMKVREALLTCWSAAQREGEMCGVPTLTASSGAGWLLERTGGDVRQAIRQADEFAADALGVGEVRWWHAVAGQLAFVLVEDWHEATMSPN